MATIRQQLSRIKHNQAARDAIRREKSAAVKRVEKSFEPKLKTLDEDDEKARRSLMTLCPFQVGDHVQRVMADGLVGGERYQVTSVSTHEKFHARLITARGQLGATVVLFNAAKKGYRVDKVRKIKKQPLK